jgi:hypothetical protein
MLGALTGLIVKRNSLSYSIFMEESETKAEASPNESTLRRLEATVARVTGQSVETIRSQSLTELRQVTETRLKGKLTFRSRFPLVGRGNVMRDKIIDHEAVESLLGQALK